MGPEEEEEEEDAPGDDAVAAPVLPTENRPTLQEYQSKWRTKLAQHAREVDGPFSKDNLCPKPVHQLWQDCGRLMRLDCIFFAVARAKALVTGRVRPLAPKALTCPLTN